MAASLAAGQRIHLAGNVQGTHPAAGALSVGPGTVLNGTGDAGAITFRVFNNNANGVLDVQVSGADSGDGIYNDVTELFGSIVSFGDEIEIDIDAYTAWELTGLNAGKLTLERLVDLTSAGAQRIYNIAGKGRIAVGYDADFTIVDMKRRQTIANDWIESRCGWTPYDGLTVTGWPVGTLVRGHRMMWDGEISGSPGGEPVRFLETLAAKP